MAYSVIDKVYTIFIDVMTGSSNGYGKPTFYNTDSHTSFIELTVTNGSKEFNMTEFSYMFTVEKPDGTKYTNEYTTKDKNKLVIPVDAQMISCTGNCNAQLYVNKEVDGVNKTLTMVEFNYTVYKGLHEGLISESIDFDNVYVKILNKLDYIINNGADLTGDQAAQLTYAYQHSKSPHAPANIVETMHTEIGEAIDVHHKKVALSASQVGSYEGTDITIKPSNEGLTKDIIIKGRTLQNLIVGGNKKSVINKTTSPYRLINYTPQVHIEQGVTYTLVVNITKIENAPKGLRLYTWNGSGNETQYINYYATTVGVHKITFSSSMKASGLSLYAEIADWNNGCTIEFDNVMLLKGDYTAPDAYIPPYFEGFKSVGDKSKNLFKGYDQEIQLEAGKTYYLSSAKTEGATRISMRVTNQDDVTPNNMYWQPSNSHYLLSADNQVLRSNIVCNKNTTVTFVGDSLVRYNNIQLEEGTVATAYEPYFEEGTSLVRYASTAKNIYNGEKQIEISKPNDKWRVVTITNVPNFELGKNYTLSYKCNEEVDLKVIVFYAIGKEAYFSSTTPISITRDRGAVVGLQFYIEDSVYNTEKRFIFSDIQIEEGTVATTYEPYQEDIKEITANISDGIKGVGEASDVIYINTDDNQVYVEQNMGHYVNVGDEAITLHTIRDNTISFNYRFNVGSLVGKDSNFAFMCNCFSTNSRCYSYDEEGCFGTKTGFYGSIAKTKLESPDLEGVKKYVKENFKECFYQLASPNCIKITTTDTINLKTFNGVTHVFSKHDFKPTISFGLDFVPLTSDAKQYCTADGNKSFILPDIASLQDSNALEIHLFVKMLANATLSFPSNILWNDLTKMSEIINGSTAEFIFTYIKTAEGGSWLGTVVPHK